MTPRFWRKGGVRVFWVLTALAALLFDGRYPGYVARAWVFYEIWWLSIWAVIGVLKHGSIIKNTDGMP